MTLADIAIGFAVLVIVAYAGSLAMIWWMDR